MPSIYHQSRELDTVVAVSTARIRPIPSRIRAGALVISIGCMISRLLSEYVFAITLYSVAYSLAIISLPKTAGAPPPPLVLP